MAVGRRKFADADPHTEELFRRIISWGKAMTRLRTYGLLAELPSKRLLMKYTQGFMDRADPPGNLQVGINIPFNVKLPRYESSFSKEETP